MSKTSVTWKQRIARARRRKRFDDDDARAIWNAQTCMIGEAAARVGLQYADLAYAGPFAGLEIRAIAIVRAGGRRFVAAARVLATIRAAAAVMAKRKIHA